MKYYNTAEEMRDALAAIAAKESILSFIGAVEAHLSSNVEFFSALQETEFLLAMQDKRTEMDLKYNELKAFRSKVVLTKSDTEDNRLKLDALYLIGRVDEMVLFIGYVDPIAEFIVDTSKNLVYASRGMSKAEFEARFTSMERGDRLVNRLYERAVRMMEELKLHIDKEFYLHEIEEYMERPF